MSNFRLDEINGIPFYTNGEGVYFTQRQIAEILYVSTSNISSSIASQIQRGFLDPQEIKMATILTSDNKWRNIKLYPVDVIFHAGFNVVRNNEVENLHPLIEQVLIQGGYAYEHHMEAPRQGILDFWARDVNGQEYIIEGKIEVETILKTIKQIKGYAVQFNNPDMRLVLAIPVEMATGDLIWQVQQEGISIWGISDYKPIRRPLRIFGILDKLLNGDAMSIIGKSMYDDLINQGKTPKDITVADERHTRLIENVED